MLTFVLPEVSGCFVFLLCVSRGKLFLNGTGDVGAVYDFVIRAVQGTGSEPETVQRFYFHVFIDDHFTIIIHSLVCNID